MLAIVNFDFTVGAIKTIWTSTSVASLTCIGASTIILAWIVMSAIVEIFQEKERIKQIENILKIKAVLQHSYCSV